MNSHQRTGQVGADALLSHLVMGFIERRIAPQTIADVVLAQLAEDGEAATQLQVATWNGVVEALVSAPNVNGLLDILVYVSKRTDFPLFLSSTATLGGLAAILAQPMALIEGIQRGDSAAASMVDSLARKSADIVAREPQHLTRAARMRLVNALKSSPAVITRLAASCPSLIVLRQLLLRLPSADREAASSGSFASATALLAAIFHTPDHVLVHHMATDYHVGSEDNQPARKLAYVDEVAMSLVDGARTCTSFQASFAVEWLFAGVLRRSLYDAAALAGLGDALRSLLSKTGPRLEILKGTVRALQRDLSLAIADGSDESGTGRTASAARLKLAADAGTVFFAALSGATRAVWPVIAPEFVPWALQLPCHPPESRLVTREQLEWLRILDQQEWLEGLQAPPPWVLAEASRTAALVFRLAPGQWLQHHAAAFIDVLHRESLGKDFVMSSAHFDYVEYLIRTARKKAPIFASEIDTLVALQILGKAQDAEQNQIRIAVARLRLMSSQPGQNREAAQMTLSLLNSPQAVERLGPSPLARALALFSHTAHAVQDKGRRTFDRRQFLPS